MDANVSLGSALAREVRAREALYTELDIVERPSAGYIRLPLAMRDLVVAAVGCMLRVSWLRSSRRAYVRCSIDHRRVLRLEVVDDGGWYDERAQWELSEIGQRAFRLKPDSTLDLEFCPQKFAAVSLILPL